MRLQTDESGKALHVVENFFVKNESNPPLTQFSDRPFEFYLPEGAVVEGSAALAPGGMPVQASPVPLGEPNHYAFIFPIRPGETRFQITYRLPYSGSLKFAPRMTMPTDTIAVMMPKSMTFAAGAVVSVYAGDGGDDGADLCGAECAAVAAVGFYGFGCGADAAGCGCCGYGRGWWSGWLLRRGGRRVRLRRILGRVVGWGIRLILRGRMIRGRSISGGFWVGLDWRWRWARGSC